MCYFCVTCAARHEIIQTPILMFLEVELPTAIIVWGSDRCVHFVLRTSRVSSAASCVPPDNFVRDSTWQCSHEVL